jgi:ATP-dependent Lhr-like helicase
MKRAPFAPAGRWSRFRALEGEDGFSSTAEPGPASPEPAEESAADFIARQLLTRYGLVFRRLIEREPAPVPWRDLVRVLRRQELRGEIRGGRFVSGFSGEQYALPEAVELMRRLRRGRGDAGSGRLSIAPDARTSPGEAGPRGLHVAAADPLNLKGILTPEPRISPQSRRRVDVA